MNVPGGEMARRFVATRRSLYAQYRMIQNVRRDAEDLIAELENRRDGFPPRELSLPYLRAVLDREYPRPGARQ